MIERRIIAGLIVSQDYLRRVAPFWDKSLIDSPTVRTVAEWCLSYYREYERPPDRHIADIFLGHAERLPKGEAQDIERMLDLVSDDYGRGDSFNSEYLYDQTVAFFRDREVARHMEEVSALRERGRLDEAEALAASFVPRSWATSRGLDLGTEPGYERVRAAFEQVSEPIVRYPGALGEFINPYLIRDGFVAIMGPSKRGKTFWLTDIVLHGMRQRCNVAFFQAGDLSESQMLRRIAVRVARRSDDPRYCGPRWESVGDCVLNQFDHCRRDDRNCDHGVYGESEFAGFRENPEGFQRLTELSRLAREYPDYRPCESSGCAQRWPCAWVKPVSEVMPLDGIGAERLMRQFFARWRRRFRLACYSSGTLTIDEIRSCLGEWERQDDFVPDVIAVDYADIMSSTERDYRHRQNDVWMGLRAVSQEYHALVVTGTQTDADSFRSDLLRKGNFTEDRRKYDHVTAMLGLNQDPGGREKDLGMMRLNVIVAREGAYNETDVVHVLQDLASGRPHTGSYRVGRAAAAE